MISLPLSLSPSPPPSLPQDVADLAVECKDEELKESKGSARLGRKVDALISKIDQTILQLESGFVTEGNGALQKAQEKR